ncbi:MAG TPA: TonB-dependent receptor [Caulobacterales bacterium]|nr:TonB-dependent receptor [Caulobacterales bacterium]
MFAPNAFAQEAAGATATNATDDTSADDDQVVVVGVRRALQNAQTLKRNADTVVDSITATDIGAFPDKSVAEALQRVAGISVTRFAASGDTTHFSAEPSGVVIRGLPQVRSEFNGRDSFNANSSRGLSFGDVSPELMAGVDTYKNVTADMIEGGLAGTVNLRTRLPFDSPGFSLALGVDVGWGDLNGEYTPDSSILISNRWNTSVGEFGLMADFAYSRVVTESQGVQLGRFYQLADNAANTAQYGAGVHWIPGGIDVRRNLYTRTREGQAFAAQWESPDHSLLATLQYNRSTYSNDWKEHSLTAAIGNSQTAQDLVLATPLTYDPTGLGYDFDSGGVFMAGVLADTNGTWAGDPNAAQTQVPSPYGFGSGHTNYFCYSWSDSACPATRGLPISADTRYSTNDNVTQDTSINLRWTPTERLAFNFDVQHIDSSVRNFDNSMDAKTYGYVLLDISGDHPQFAFTPNLVVNGNPVNLGWAMQPGGYSNPANYYHEWTMEHAEDSAGTENAYRIDAEYSVGSSWLDSVRVGVRRAERQQDVNWSTYNWGSVQPLWGLVNEGFYLNQSPWNSQTVEPINLGSNILGGGVFNGGVFLHPLMSIASDYATTIATFGGGRSNSWIPLGQRACAVPGSLYCPAEMLNVEEDTNAAYIMLKFGGEDFNIGGFNIRGNIGVRYVETEVSTHGGTQFPLWTPPSSCVASGVPPIVPAQCFVDPNDVLFQNGASPTSDSNPSIPHGATHDNFLPSFNLRIGLTDDQYLRFAISRGLARPDMGLYKSFYPIAASQPDCLNTTYSPACVPGQVTPNAGQQATLYSPTYQAQAGNPNLAPTTADQIDLTYEWYFSDTGSFTAAVFYKKFHDYILYTNQVVNFTNNGVTRPVVVGAPDNFQGGSVKGFELAYQQFFDFLPAPFDGFGVQANYTYVENQGVNNSNVSIVSGSGGTQQDGFIRFTNLPLEGYSKETYNVVGMYEKGPLALRLAYNWRSEYLVSQADCCIKLPIWQDPYGQLDGSIRYRYNDRLEFFAEAQNLTSSETVLRQQVTNDGMTLPRSWFINDRRFQIGLRYRR